MKTYAVLIAALLAAPAFGDCKPVDWSERPRIPDGSAASAEQMHTARDEVVAYVAAGEAYLECAEPNRFLHNFVVVQVERTADKFNRERERFQERQSLVASN